MWLSIMGWLIIVALAWLRDQMEMVVNILTRYDLESIEEQTDVIGDVDAWMASYEQGDMARAWEQQRRAAIKALTEWRDRFG